mgnify:CR=1 FL=1
MIDNLAAPELWRIGMEALAPHGRLVTSGAKFGGTVEIDVRALYTLSKRVVGLRSAAAQDHDAFWSLVESAGVRALVDSVFPLEKVADAHRLIESGGNVGRVVLTI